MSYYRFTFFCESFSISTYVIRFYQKKRSLDNLILSFLIIDDFRKTAYQIFDFLLTSNNQYFSISSFETKFTIQNIIIISFRSIRVRRIFESFDRKIRNSSIESSQFSSEWIIDKWRFRVNVNKFVIITKTYRFIQHYINWNNVNQQTSAFISDRDDIVTSNRLYSIDVIFEFSFSKASRRDVKSQSSSEFDEVKLLWFTIESALRDEFLSNYINFNLTTNDNSSINFFINRNKEAITQSSFNIFSFFTNMINWQDIDFIEQQWNVLQTFIRFDSLNSQKQSDSVESSNTIIAIVDVVDIWNSQKVNYFDFFYNNKITIINDLMKHVDKNTYFRDVYNFIKRIQNMIIIKNHKLIRDNLYTCFKNKTLHWYISILISDVKRIIKYDENIDEWKRTFLKRWKQFVIFVVFIFKKTEYTMKNVRRKRESMKYALEIIKTAKIIEMSMFSQVTLIYIDLKLKFQRNMTKSTEITTMNDCVQQLKNNKK